MALGQLRVAVRAEVGQGDQHIDLRTKLAHHALRLGAPVGEPQAHVPERAGHVEDALILGAGRVQLRTEQREHADLQITLVEHDPGIERATTIGPFQVGAQDRDAVLSGESLQLLHADHQVQVPKRHRSTPER
jgi:hypothetical protein